MDKPWKVLLAFGGIFLAGAIFGLALAPRWLDSGPAPGQGRPGQGRRPPAMLERLSKQLELTPEQKEKIAPIIRQVETDTRQLRRDGVQKFRAMMDKANNEISTELTPEQRTKFDELRKRFRERIDRVRSEARERAGLERDEPEPGGQQPPPPPPAKDDKST